MYYKKLLGSYQVRPGYVSVLEPPFLKSWIRHCVYVDVYTLIMYHQHNGNMLMYHWCFKKGSKTDPKNYRPISLTSVVCKSMEHIIVSQIMKHLDKYNILTDSQFGFRTQHSCESQLFVTINDIAKV